MTQSSAEFGTIVDELGRRRLADCIVCAIEDRFGYDYVTKDERSIPRPFRLAHIVFQTTGFLGGDGLHGLLSLPCKTTYPNYLRELGFEDLARKLRRYVRWNFLFGQKRIRDLEKELFRNSNRIAESVGDFIANNATDFESLLPEARQTLAYLEHFDPAGYERKLSEPDPTTELMKAITAGLRSGQLTIEDVRRISSDQCGG
ncbi:hypothetical protein [Rhodopirellula halodulae]|uniref:hypothetical protein n=1 Tax=Rhodopirellula halodulae TaxID=2894198 RepID=UPI001E2E8DD4|nr:hypothetical protein [Rhodopirellula sp. JC737]MCC9654197.1 hypothetical protein [Rhodopirellula sp. JC737]